MLKKIIIKGMSCSHCVNHVRQALSELKDSQKVEVNLEQKYAIVETSSNDEEIKEKIEDQGYDVISIENI
ncbi:heavy-metal-associated domain-containing protein [Clostridium sp.]|uniref:heavy-metal-associated domain-containing protein n=1 Tax=Clostridium sp. TaxID=1506 RepID=UPI0025C38A74|nr:cation transporter [Clostridium sp.]